MSLKDIRLTLGGRNFLVKQVPFRESDANALSAGKLAEIVAKRLAGSDSTSSFRPGDDAKKAWEYISQRKPVELEIVEVSASESKELFDAESTGKIVLHTEFQGQERQFIVGLRKSEAIIKLMNKIGIDSSTYTIQDQAGVINGLSLDDLKQLLAAINARSTSTFSLPSHDFIRHRETPIAEYLKNLGISRVWLKEESRMAGTGAIYDFGLHASMVAASGSPDSWIGVILEVTR